MVHLDELNQDVLNAICALLARRDLASLAATATALRSVAESFLWKHISFRTDEEEMGVALWFLIKDRGRRARFVSTLSIHVYSWGNSRDSELSHTINMCRSMQSFSLNILSGAVPFGRVKKFPTTLTSLDVAWGCFAPADLFRLLGIATQLQSLTILNWPVDEAADGLPAGALPALRSLTGSEALVTALLPGRELVTAVRIDTANFGSPVIDLLAEKDIRDLDISFDNYTIEDICRACPRLEIARFTGADIEDLAAWLEGRIPEGWRTLTRMRSLKIIFSMMQGEAIARGSATRLRDQLSEIWPSLESVRFYREVPWCFLDAA